MHMGELAFRVHIVKHMCASSYSLVNGFIGSGAKNAYIDSANAITIRRVVSQN